MSSKRAKVYLVGAGPGDPRLLTLRAVEVLGRADVVLKDALVNPHVLRHVRAGATITATGKRAGGRCCPQQEINRLLCLHARAGKTVVRLKGGDPFIFGRGGEEAEVLEKAGIAFEIVPGISAGIAAPAYAGIPLLHREHSSSVAFVSGHPARDGKGRPWATMKVETLVIFMGASSLVKIAHELIAGGRTKAMPVAIIESGTHEQQHVWVGCLEEVASLRNPVFEPPVLVVVGVVASFATKLAWFGAAAANLRALQDRPTAFGM